MMNTTPADEAAYDARLERRAHQITTVVMTVIDIGLAYRSQRSALASRHMAVRPAERQNAGKSTTPTPTAPTAKLPQLTPGRSGRPLDHQVAYKGHTKMQAYGPGYSLRREIQIAPGVKGPQPTL